VELIPELSLAFAHCAAGDVSDDRCTGVRGGGGFGFSAIWRVTPYLAWGGGFDIAGFRYEPPERLGLRRTGAAAAQLRLIGRAYFLSEGSFDPYVELGIGGAALGTSARDANGDSVEETGAGPALSIGGGLDFMLSRRLRLGPQLTVTQVFVDKIQSCRARLPILRGESQALEGFGHAAADWARIRLAAAAGHDAGRHIGGAGRMRRAAEA
jgi:hypothetical protein